ncbi:PucR family transcriptional regulator ligand-binding domain-containing protein [Fuchsiella alkaliacetigena]|uniref:PucR family transcriptional regulator ligand-binding domain-containing protein n=1 Tax=Fuchsiella alkaliacetigena TaxID=957042 RepID=UPI00200B90F8|nr:PucR family transcriptional regulator ligand-binding domain-containing protein [Fuchsiella alkaliacetigena]MCK8825710.1 PucR family transcriptional regulator ligand-binding domain-containing protein [Fuchsiella alkaliacetigena]
MELTNKIGITVAEILELEAFKGTNLVAGAAGIDNSIKQVNIMEVPDISQWVKEGELLLTTAYSIKDDCEALSNLIPKLAEKNLAGLAIKTGRYIEKIPELMINQANRLDFPLLELPYAASFSELIKPVLSEILNVQASFLRKSLSMHEDMMNVVLKGGGLNEIAENLSSLIANPVLIVDAEFKVLSWARADNKLFSLADLVNQKAKEEDFTIESFGSYYLSKSLIKEDRSVGRFKRTEVEINDKKLLQMSLPIIGGGKVQGYIFTWELNSQFKKVDLLAIERSSTVAALEMMNQQAIFEVERRYQNELLFDILNGRFDSRTTINDRAVSMGWELNQAYAVLIFDLSNGLANLDFDQKRIQELRSKILTELNSYFKSFSAQQLILGDRGTNIIMLYSAQDFLEQGLAKQEIKEKIEEFIRKLIKIIQRILTGKVVVGVGNYYQDIQKLQDSYEEARSVLKVVQDINFSKQVHFFEELGVYRLIYNLSPTEIDSFLADTIQPLLEYDQQNNTDFINTLKEYFRCNGNLKKISEKLFLHYNSVLYRIKRIQEILNVNLNDHEKRLSLEMGLKLLDFYD